MKSITDRLRKVITITEVKYPNLNEIVVLGDVRLNESRRHRIDKANAMNESAAIAKLREQAENQLCQEILGDDWHKDVGKLVTEINKELEPDSKAARALSELSKVLS
jgi:hypothetical protein